MLHFESLNHAQDRGINGQTAKVFTSDFLGFLAVYGLRKAIRHHKRHQRENKLRGRSESSQGT
jgi:hypothetical protein